MWPRLTSELTAALNSAVLSMKGVLFVACVELVEGCPGGSETDGRMEEREMKYRK